jgi:hypothetical protein
MKCPNCKAENPSTAMNCLVCGAELVNLYAAPTSKEIRPEPAPIPDLGGGDETVSTIIPYKNPAALIAYYLGLFSCCPVPILGLTMAIVSIVLAIKGFKAARLNPKAHGTAHAWIGLICGSFGVMIGLVMVTAMIFAIIAAATKK